MSNGSSIEKAAITDTELLDRRLFLRSIGKWSGAAVLAAVVFGFPLPQRPAPLAGSIEGGPYEGAVGSMEAGVAVGSTEESGVAVGSIAGR
jgi:hypothetical protein